MREHFAKELESLQQMLREISAKAENAVVRAVKAITAQDAAEAGQVIGGDSEIDAMEVKIEEECLKLIALYQPVAGDLRSIVTILKINNEIERVADLAAHIAERAIDMTSYRQDEIEKFDFCDMVAKAHTMLRKAIGSFVYRDSLMAIDVIRSDDEIDMIHRNNYGKIKNLILAYPDATGYYLDCLTVSRVLERIADVATNICEDVIYLEQGRIVRHQYNRSEETHVQRENPDN